MKKIFNEFIAFAMFSMIVALIGLYFDYDLKKIEAESDLINSTVISCGNIVETHSSASSKTSSKTTYRQSITVEYSYRGSSYKYIISDAIVPKEGRKIGDTIKIYANKENPSEIKLYSYKAGGEPLYLFAIIVLAIGTAKTLICATRLRIKEENTK